jgi:acetyl esterase/lipase
MPPTRDWIFTRLCSLLVHTRRPYFTTELGSFSSFSESTYKLEDHIVPVEDGEIRVRTISPTPTPNEDSEFPVLVYLYGGGAFS